MTKLHPEDWARIFARGTEVMIDRVELRDEDDPMSHVS